MLRFLRLDASAPRLTREGIYYVGVMLFVISGAVVKQLNLLVLLCGMLAAPLVLHLRMVSISLRRLYIQRRVPKRAYAGDPVHVQLAVVNPRRLLPSWMILVSDRIHLQDHEGRPAATNVEVRFPLVRAGQQAWSSYRICLSRRGRYTLGPARVSTRFPLGLFYGRRLARERDELIVVPRIGRLTPRWTRLTFGEQAGGQQTMSRQGLTEAEFYGLREWRAGDSRRWIHWRTSARLDTLAVRQFERQRQADLGLLLDLWLPERPSEQQLLDLERAISFAATVVQQLASDQNTWLAFVIAGRQTQSWKGPVTAGLVEEILRALAMVRGADQPLGEARRELRSLMRSRGRRIVISSRPDPASGDLAAPRRGQDASRGPQPVNNGKPHQAGKAPADEAHGFGELAWIDVSSAESRQYFDVGPEREPTRAEGVERRGGMPGSQAQEVVHADA